LQGTGPGLGGSTDPVITPDGRYIAFTSTAEDLVEGDTNGLADVFVRDLFEQSTERISVGSVRSIIAPGSLAGSSGARLSADGRWVVFSSTATNLVPGVTNLHGEVYLRDRLQGTMICPSDMAFVQWTFPEGARLLQRRAFHPSMSEDGRYLVFVAELMLSAPFGIPQSLWRFEIASGQPTLITTNLTFSEFVEPMMYTISPNGRWVAFVTESQTNSNNITLWDGAMGDTVLATPAIDGSTGANGICGRPELSADGRFLVFTSIADNLVTNTLTHDFNVFVRDLEKGQTALITADATGTGLGGADLVYPTISHDGKWVVFDSFQSGFVPDDKNFASDIFMHERETGAIDLVSRVDPAAQCTSGNGHSSLGPSPFSNDGSRLLFRSGSSDPAPGRPVVAGQIHAHDVATAANTLVSVNTDDAAANARCHDQVISGDGRSVAFVSVADNLTQGDTNGRLDVFVHDLGSRATTLISRVPQSGFSGNDKSDFPALSHDGNWVAFLSDASDLMEPEVGSEFLQAYLHDRQNQVAIRVSHPLATSVEAATPKMSPDGRYLAYVNRRWPSDTWLYDRDDAQREEIVPGTAVAALGGDYFSRDGHYLVTWGWGNNSAGTIEAFVMRRNLNTGTDEQLLLGPNRGLALANLTLDDAGRFVAFSTALGLVPADTNERSDVYLLDFESRSLTLISLNSLGTAAGGGDSRDPSFSGDGRLVAFASEAGDLVPNDTNGTADLFVFDRYTGTLSVASVNPAGSVGDGHSGNPRLSPNGYRLAFTSLATSLVGGDRNARNDVFLTTVHPTLTTDTDNDAMADDWEIHYFSGLEALPEQDPDLDGFPNLAEYIAGTDPRDPGSHLRIEIATNESNEIQLYWAAAPGRSYVVESTFDLVIGEWTGTPGIVRRTGALAQFEEMESREAPAYYRLRIANDAAP
jgi:Tol biopolymer transport system component